MVSGAIDVLDSSGGVQDYEKIESIEVSAV